MHVAVALASLLLSAAPSTPTEAQSAAVELSRVSLPRENWDQAMAASRDQVRQIVAQSMDAAAKQQSVALPADLAERVMARLSDDMQELMPGFDEMIDFQAGLLQKHFTAGELQQLLAFYRSPLGKKIVKVQPEVMRDVMGWTQARLQQRLPGIMERASKLVSDYQAEQKAK